MIHQIARRRKLEEEADMLFDELLKHHGSNHISSANLMTTMGSLTNIAKNRPVYMAKVITGMSVDFSKKKSFLLTFLLPVLFFIKSFGDCLLYTSPSPRD